MNFRSHSFLLDLIFLGGLISTFAWKVPNLQDPKIDWSPVDTVLEVAIANGTFPGCVAVVGNKEGFLYATAKGSFTYGVPPPMNNGENPPMTINTLFDMASCSKVTATTSAVAQFYQRGELNLNTRIVDILGSEYGQNGKTDITVLNCLLHNTGYPPDPDPNYNDPAFGCPETKKYHPLERFNCQDQIYASLMSQVLENPIGTIYVYSDLSMITLMYVVGTLAKNLNYISQSDLNPSCVQNPKSPAISQCYFEAYVRKYVFSALSMTSTGYLPPSSVWANAAPCENDTDYLHETIQGQVSDGNAYAMGGIAGHAGVFSNVNDLFILMHRVMFPKEHDPVFINKTTAEFFTKEYNHSQSSRALGWNTNDPTVFDYGWDQLCGDLSPTTFTHVGYTGTQLCGDPDRKIITILLTNRVYPSAANMKVEDVRRKFNNAVVSVVDKYYPN